METYVCDTACSPMRAEPSHRSEMVSQLLFGETVTGLARSGKEWIRVRNEWDGYEGWCSSAHCTPVDIRRVHAGRKRLCLSWAGEIALGDQRMIIPFGSVLLLDGSGCISWSRRKLRFLGESWDPGNAARKWKVLTDICRKFLHVSYLWGGKSVFGTDCSGFTQTVFRFLDIALPRDAWQQAAAGEPVNSISNARPGDLMFFDNKEGKITHTGILLPRGRIMHASGSVRIDRIDAKGIIRHETAQRTHPLRQIRRII